MIETILLLTSFITSLISGIFGMAGGVLLMGVLLTQVPVASSMILHGYLQFISNANRTLQIYKNIFWKTMGHYILGSLLALSLFMIAQFLLPIGYVYLVLGLIPALLFIPPRWAFDFSRPSHAFICGFSTSGLQFLSGVNGPLLDIFFVNTKLNRFQIVATKAFTQTLSHTVKVIYFLSLGRELTALKELPLWFYVLCVPVSIAGTFCGIQILNRMTDKSFIKYTRWLICAIGAYYLYMSYITIGASQL